MGDVDISARLAEAKKRKWDDRTLAQRAADLAQELLPLAIKALRSDENTLLAALSRLATDKANRHFVQELCTHVLRAPSAAAQSSQFRKLLAAHGGIPTLFSSVGRLRLRAASLAASSLEGAAMAEVRRVFRSTFGALLLPLPPEKISRRVREFHKDKLALAINPLSPEVFGKKSAERYQKSLENLLNHPDGVGVSVQPWRLVPGLSPYRPTLAARELAARLKPLLQLSVKGAVARPIIVETGTSDIMPVIIEGFKLAMAGSAFYHANVMLELPGYLRQSPEMLQKLTAWAQARAAKGARPLSIMFNKGSHLEEERACTYVYGAANAAAASKGEADTRYKNLVHQAMSAKPKVLRPAIATHNLFDLAYGLLDWARSGRDGLPDIVLRAGLGNHIGRMLSRAGANVTLVTGLVSETDEAEFELYLLRLINEAAAPDGLHASGSTASSQSMAWSRMRQQFLASLSGREEGSTSGNDPRFKAGANAFLLPEGNLATAMDSSATEAILSAAANAPCGGAETPLPLLINDEETDSPLCGIHRSHTTPGAEEYRFIYADYKAVNQVLHLAAASTAGAPLAPEERSLHLQQFAQLLENHRQELCALLIRDAAFTLPDADTELRDAADACRFYAKSATQDGLLDGTQPQPLGVLVVATSRAHPLADAVSGLAAAWITGNSIIYKPAPGSIRLGYRLAELAREAGFSSPRFQCIACPDNQIADKLMTDPRTDGTLLSGHASLAARLATQAPARPLFNTAAGISTVYLAAGCNWQLAVHDLAQAAYRRSGQAANCPGVIIVDASVYDNQQFMNAMQDAVSSLRTQPGWMEAADLGPLSRPLSAEQLRLLSDNHEDETWHVQPEAHGPHSQLWSPGLVRGARAASPLTALAARELPVMTLIRVNGEAEALATQKKISAAGAAALYTQDEELMTRWSQNMSHNPGAIGKLFINCCPQSRPGLLPETSTPLPAQRTMPQPGGPHFLTALCNWQEIVRPQQRGSGTGRHIAFTPWNSLMPKPSPEDSMRLTAAAGSLACWWEREFGVKHELKPYEGVEVTRHYVPHPVCLRAEKESSDIDISIAILAALTAGSELQLSSASLRAWMPRAFDPLGISVTVEPREDFEARFPALAARGICVRDTAATDATRRAAAAAGLQLCTASILANGRLELLHYLRECVVCRKGKLADT